MSDFCIKCNGLGEPDFSFSVAKTVSSQNTMGGNKGGARWGYARDRSAWIDALCQAVERGAVTVATGRRVVRITRQFAGRKRELDYGNLVGGLKMVVDAMQREIGGKKKTIPGAGIITDDSSRGMISIYAQKRAESDAVLFEIWELID